MKAFMVLFGFSLAFAYEEPYRGFDECGYDGWFCDYAKGKYNITYKCPKDQPNGRVWVWTARLPVGTTSFTVRDCRRLEVHIDCPKGPRTTILREFNVINITNLDILHPTAPGVYLHDNDQIPQVPPILNIQDVKKIRWYPGIFEKPGGGCRYKYLELTSISFVNVHIDRIMKNLFYNRNLDKFIMKDVVIDAIDGNAISVAADTSISTTYFPFMPNNAISIKGVNISFVNNTFKKIQTLGLLVRSRNFKFSKNNVEEVNTEGLDVMGANIEVTENNFTHIETGAFQKITPGYSPLSYEVASKFIYNFSDNVITNFSPGSMHLNWEVYKKVCSEIIFKNNILGCSCTNLGWMSVSNGLGPKISKVREFYDQYLNTEHNKCKGYKYCPLNSIIPQIQEVCNKKINVSEICASQENITTTELTTSPDEINLTESSSKRSEESLSNKSNEHIIQANSQDITEKRIPFSLTENQTTNKEGENMINNLFILIPVMLIKVAILIGIFTWYKKRKQRQLVTTIYKNEKSSDADNLIIINERTNELYDKQ